MFHFFMYLGFIFWLIFIVAVMVLWLISFLPFICKAPSLSTIMFEMSFCIPVVVMMLSIIDFSGLFLSMFQTVLMTLMKKNPYKLAEHIGKVAGILNTLKQLRQKCIQVVDTPRAIMGDGRVW